MREKHPPGPNKEDRFSKGTDLPPTISEILGMDPAAAKKLSSEAQLLAKLKADAPERHAEVRSRTKTKTEARRQTMR